MKNSDQKLQTSISVGNFVHLNTNPTIMKKITISSFLLFGAIFTTDAQNVDVQKETVITRVVTTNNLDTEIKVTEEVEENLETIEVDDTDDINATGSRTKSTNHANNVLEEENIFEAEKAARQKKEAEAQRLKNQKAMQAEIEIDRQKALEEAALEKAKIDAENKALEIERLERKAELERGVGQSKERAKQKSKELKKANETDN